MRKWIAKMFYVGAFFFALVSCSEQDRSKSLLLERELQLNVVIQQTTKQATDTQYKTTFSSQDSIGVFVYKRASDGSDGEPVVVNHKYTYQDHRWVAQGEALIIKEGAAVNVYAYFPYDAAKGDYRSIPASIRLDQSDAEDFYASDFLIAKNTTSLVNERFINLVFNHAFSLVEVRVNGPKATDQEMKLTLKNILPDASLNLVGGVATTPVGAASEVKMYPFSKEPQAMIYRAIIPGQTLIAHQEILSITSTQGNYNFQHTSDLILINRKVQPININLGESPLPTLTFLPTGFGVSGWEPNDSLQDTPEHEGGAINLSDLISIPLNNMPALADLGTKLPSADNIASTRWYIKTKASDTDATPMKCTFESDLTYGKTLSFNMARAKDNLYCVGFFRKEAYAPGQYKLSFKAKSSNASGSSDFLVKMIGSVSDGKGFVVTGTTSCGGKVSFTAADANVWKDCSVTFDFSKVDGGAAAVPTAYKTLDVRMSGTANVQFTLANIQLVRVEP